MPEWLTTRDAGDGLVWDLRTSLLWGAPDTWRWRDGDNIFSLTPTDRKPPPGLNFQTSITPAPPPALDYLSSSILLSILLLQADGASRTLRVQAHLTPNPGLLFDELLRNGWRSIVPCALEPPVLEAGEGAL